MALAVEHPDIHWYFPVVRPKGASGDRLVGALEDARMAALAERKEQPLRPSHHEEIRGLYLGVVRNIRKRAHMRPTMAPGQVFIVGDAELLVPQASSPAAANALLKLLEEPPGQARFILTSGEPGRLLPTIRSRTVSLHLGRLEHAEVASFLEAHTEVDPAVAKWAAGLGQGSIGRALGFLPDGDEVGSMEALRRKAFAIVTGALTARPAAGHTVALGYSPSNARTQIDLFAFVEEWLRDLAAIAAGADHRAVNQDAVKRMTRLVAESGLPAVRLSLAMSHVDRARELIRGNVNPQLVVSGLIRDLGRTLSGTLAPVGSA
jgi:DNA polymerase III subunit delta'